MSEHQGRATATTGRSKRIAALVAVVTFVVLVCITLLVGRWVDRRELQRARAEAAVELGAHAQTMQAAVGLRLGVQRGLTEYVEAEKGAGIVADEFQSFAGGLRRSVPGIVSMHIAPDAVVRYVSPREYDATLAGRDLRTDTRPGVAAAVERAILTGDVVMSGPYTLLTGQYGLSTRQAVYNDDDTLWGIVSLQIELDPLLQDAGLLGGTSDLDIALRSSEGSMVAGSAEVFDRDPVTASVRVADQTWILAGVPSEGWQGPERRLNDNLVLGLGILLSLLGAVSTYFMSSYGASLRAQVVARTQSIAEMNERLESELQLVRTAEETLRASEDRFRRLWEGMPLPVLGGAAGVIQFCNMSLATMLGYRDPSELVGMAIVDLVAPAERPVIARRMRDRDHGIQVPSGYTTHAIKSDGTEFPARLDVIRLELADGPVSVVFVTDLSERRLAEQVLRDAAAQYRALFENSPVSLWEEDFSAAKRYLETLEVPADELYEYLMENDEVFGFAASGMVVRRVNRATLEVAGARNEAELTGPLGPKVVQQNRELFARQMVALVRGETRFFGATEVPRADGGLVYSNVYWTVAPGHEATFDTVFVSIIDLSDQHRMQLQLERYKDSLETLVDERTRELQDSNRELLEATKAKDKFLAAMSHELRTPLNSIIGFSGTLLQGLAGELNEEQIKQLTLVQRSGKHLLMLVNQVLDLSRIEAGQEEPEYVEFEVRPFVERVVEDVSTLAKEKGLRLEADALEAPTTIESDPDRLKQVLLNLLGNAIKFTEQGSVQLVVSHHEGLVTFRVRDTGPGISYEDQPHVFEAFYQMRTAAGHKPAGTGLGLSISRELVELLGGTITLESAPGEGTCFVVRIPARRPAVDAPGGHDDGAESATRRVSGND